MTQEEKDLLLKDLCSRLPYGVKVQIDLQSNIYPPMICKVCNIEFAEMGGSFIGVEVLPDSYSEYREFLCKPCLYPLSSMTEEDHAIYSKIWEDVGKMSYLEGHHHLINTIKAYKAANDYLLSKYYDIDGLIPMGLAIDATNKNIY